MLVTDLLKARYGLGRLNINLILATVCCTNTQIFSIYAIMFFTIFTGLKKRMANTGLKGGGRGGMAKSLLQLACDKLLKCAWMTLKWQ